MNFRDTGCKDLEVSIGQQVFISNPARKENNQQGKIVELEKSLFHVGNILVQINDHQVWFCACELKT